MAFHLTCCGCSGGSCWNSIWSNAVFPWTLCINVLQQRILHIGNGFYSIPILLLPSTFLQWPCMCVVCDCLRGTMRHPICLLLNSHDFLDSVSTRVSLPLPLLAHSLDAAEDGAASVPCRVVESYVGSLKCRCWGGWQRGGWQESRGGWGCGAAFLAGQGDALIHRGRSQVVILDMQVGTYLLKREKSILGMCGSSYISEITVLKMVNHRLMRAAGWSLAALCENKSCFMYYRWTMTWEQNWLRQWSHTSKNTTDSGMHESDTTM